MQTAIFVFVASTLGVSFGWQPMPDGSESYEYIVQLDRELLAQLERGESVPISTDIPDSVQPIRRIRIVAGNQDLPRRELVTQFKPNTDEIAAEDASPDTDIVRGQYAQGSHTNIAPRYSSQPNRQDILPTSGQSNSILPRGSQLPNGNQIKANTQEFARSLQRTAEQTRDAFENEIVPRAQAILPKQASDILPRQATNISPKQSSPQNSNNIRSANSSSQADIRQLFGDDNNSAAGTVRPADRRPVELRPATGNRYNTADNRSNALDANNNTGQPILPRGTAQNNTVRTNNTSQTNSTLPRSNNTAPSNQNPITTDGRYARNNQQPASGNVPPRRTPDNSQPVTNNSGIQAKWPEPKRFEDAPLAQQYDTQNGRYSDNNQNGVHVGVPSNGESGNMANRNGQDNASRASSILSFPNGSQNSQNNLQTSQTKTSPTVPEIRREMLNQPANAGMNMASDRSTGTSSFNTPRAGSPQAQPSNFASSNFNSPHASEKSNFFNTRSPAEKLPIGPTPGTPDTNSGGSKSAGKVFPLILAWVLLSGSGAGNLYLFWSYLDIRNKYHSLVRSAGRKLGRRYLDDRYGEEEYEK